MLNFDPFEVARIHSLSMQQALFTPCDLCLTVAIHYVVAAETRNSNHSVMLGGISIPSNVIMMYPVCELQQRYSHNQFVAELVAKAEMFNDDIDQDPVSNALKSRRIPHGRTRHSNRGGKGSGGSIFDPLRATGVYNIRHGTATKGSKHDGTTGGGATSRLIIHGLTDQETGLLASLEVDNLITGMAVFAGSRKELNRIVEDLETIDSDENEDPDGDEAGLKITADDADERKFDDESQADPDEVQQSQLEAEDERINRRAKVFEKNSFRNPKFWMRWKGRVKGEGSEGVSESNSGYIVFAGNDCTSFSGTISSDVLHWQNVRLEGQKINPHAGDCPLVWTDFD